MVGVARVDKPIELVIDVEGGEGGFNVVSNSARAGAHLGLLLARAIACGSCACTGSTWASGKVGAPSKAVPGHQGADRVGLVQWPALAA